MRTCAVDDLDQHHPRHGVEEVQPDQPARVFQRRADLLQRDAGRIGCEQRGWPGLRLQRNEQFPLGVEILEDGFDDDVGPRRAVAGYVRNQAVECVAHSPRILEAIGKELAGTL